MKTMLLVTMMSAIINTGNVEATIVNGINMVGNQQTKSIDVDCGRETTVKHEGNHVIRTTIWHLDK